MVYKLSVTKRVNTSLRSIHDYISDVLLNESAAQRTVEKILMGFDRLTIFPEAGFNADQRYGKQINETFVTRAIIIDNYIALYFIDTENMEVVVTHLFSSKSDYIRLL